MKETRDLSCKIISVWARQINLYKPGKLTAFAKVVSNDYSVTSVTYEVRQMRRSSEVRMVWCGVVWCGVVWCGVVWCGVVWCGVVWCGVVWCGARFIIH